MRRLIAETINSPAAGSDWSITPSKSEWTKIVSLYTTLSTDATVANRIVQFLIKDPSGNVAFRIATNITQTASKSWSYSVTQALGNSYDNGANPDGVAVIAIPCFYLPPLWSINSQTTGIDSGDQWINMYLLAYQTDEQEEAHDFAVIEKAITAQNG